MTSSGTHLQDSQCELLLKAVTSTDSHWGQMLGMPCWCALVKTKKEEAENEDNKEMYQAVGLKEDVIEKRRKLAGAASVYEDTKSRKDSEKKLDARRARLISFP